MFSFSNCYGTLTGALVGLVLYECRGHSCQISKYKTDAFNVPLSSVLFLSRCPVHRSRFFCSWKRCTERKAHLSIPVFLCSAGLESTTHDHAQEQFRMEYYSSDPLLVHGLLPTGSRLRLGRSALTLPRSGFSDVAFEPFKFPSAIEEHPMESSMQQSPQPIRQAGVIWLL